LRACSGASSPRQPRARKKAAPRPRSRKAAAAASPPVVDAVRGEEKEDVKNQEFGVNWTLKQEMLRRSVLEPARNRDGLVGVFAWGELLESAVMVSRIQAAR
jgi:hypothetical protein